MFGEDKRKYRGRIAPTPSGFLHAGHAKTFRTAWQRAREAGGTLIYRNDDLDPQRSKTVYVEAAMEDLKALGIDWDEGPDLGGPCTPYNQSSRGRYYLKAWCKLLTAGCIYPCNKSRKEIADVGVLSNDQEEYIYPSEFRPHLNTAEFKNPGSMNWRFRVPEDCKVILDDICCGRQEFQGGADFGDFLVWRKDGTASYELATVVDEISMAITEVVRGADLLKSTARQCLVFEALGRPIPRFYHCSLLLGPDGKKLSKSQRLLGPS